jgi:hypothetical protein
MNRSCSAVRRRLPEYHDRELTIDQQVAIEAHLRACPACAAQARSLHAVSDVLHLAALQQAREADSHALDGLASDVISRMRAEREESLPRTLERMFEDLHLVWAALGATAATLACVAITVGIFYLGSRSERPDSLAALIAAISNPGSNENPVDASTTIALPRQENNDIASIPENAKDEELCALNATITREGRVAEMQLLMSEGLNGSGTTAPNWKIVGEMLDSAARARFEPARSGGAPVAVNMVWLLAHVTVRPKARGEVRAPAPAPAPVVPVRPIVA